MNVHRIPGARPLALTAGAAAALAIGLAAAGPANPAAATQSPSARVANDTLIVTGTSHGDRIALRLAPSAPGTMEVDLNDDGTAEHSFDRTTFSRIEVSARSGGDQFRVDQANGSIDEPATVDGGSGNDTLNGGDGIELFIAGSGNDAVDGNRGDDTGVLGSGKDSFRWDPGDGSDVVEGRSGTDTLDFNGAGLAESMSLSPNAGRSLFLREPGNIRMDMDGVERLDLTALGGADTLAVRDMSGTDFRRAAVDLSAPTGGGDGQADSVTVNGTERADRIDVEANGARVDVEGLRTEVRIAGSETIDRLQVISLGGNDDVDVEQAVFALIAVAVDLGSGQL
jgi:Ca2+-binding RTX toxin-like protein